MESDLFVFELSTEEIPASYQEKAYKLIEKVLSKTLKESELNFESLEAFATPRRLGFILQNAQPFTPKSKEELKGPPKSFCFDEKGKATPALLGFAKKAKIDPDDISFKADSGKEYATASVTKGGIALEQVISQSLQAFLNQIQFPKTMRWGSGKCEYPRPILGYWSAYGPVQINLSFQGSFESISRLKQLRVGFKREDCISPASAQDYLESMNALGIILNPDLRKNKIREQLAEVSGLASNQPDIDESLLREVTYLVENPVVLEGTFENEFLKIPEPVIVSEMKEHQRYFPQYKDGQITNQFLIVANKPLDSSEQYFSYVISGNERVLRARLSDGAFFFREDQKTPLVDRVDKLKSILYLDGFGSLYDKCARVGGLAGYLKPLFQNLSLDEKEIKETAFLIKTDLTTQMVFEFDHLQGEIGEIYAIDQGLPESVTTAIREHYLPRRQGDSLPETNTGALFALADKLDNLFVGFCSGNKPTSSQDPMGLRRQLLYAIEIIVKFELSFNLKEALDVFWLLLGKKSANVYQSSELLFNDFWPFVQGRLKTVFEKSGFSPQMIRAGLNTSGTPDLLYLHEKLSALLSISNSGSQFSDMMAAFVRMKNLVSNHEQREGDISVDKSLFQKKEEQNLFGFSTELHQAAEHASGKIGLEQVFSKLADGKNIVDVFFDNVMVNDPDPQLQMNRIALLKHVLAPVEKIIKLEDLK